MDALAVALKMSTYPLIAKLLQIFATIPLTTATNERLSSVGTLLKTFLHTAPSEDRLMAHLYISEDIYLECDAVVDEIKPKNKRPEYTQSKCQRIFYCNW